MQMDEAYEICEGVVKQHSSSFYNAFSQLPTAERQAVWAVYAYCRMVDNMVDEGDEPSSERLAQLAEVERLLALAKLGQWSRDMPVWMALEDTFQRFPMSFEPFEHMIEGQRRDLDFEQPKTIRDLEHYCYLVAGTVGLMLLPILVGQGNERMQKAAVDLGLAMQLTNILRDVREDAAIGRIYLPLQWMQACHVNADDIQTNLLTDHWRQLAAKVARHADRKYRRGLMVAADYPATSRLAFLAAGWFYRGILHKIVSLDYDVFHERVYLSDADKTSLLLRLEDTYHLSSQFPDSPSPFASDLPIVANHL